MNRQLIRFVLAVFSFVLLVSCGGNSDDDTPLIFAAASLSNVLAESAEIYERETGERVEFSFGGSLTLANQIAEFDAPADGAFLVGEAAIERIADAGLVDGDGYGTMLFNQLVVVGSSGSASVTELSELEGTTGRVAIGNPELAPVGAYAKQALTSAGIWKSSSDRLVLTSDVRSALAAVTSGNVEYAIVYTSDLASADPGSVEELMVIEEGYDRIFYTFVPIKGSRNAAGVRAFKDFLASSKSAQEIFNSAGFQWNVFASNAREFES